MFDRLGAYALVLAGAFASGYGLAEVTGGESSPAHSHTTGHAGADHGDHGGHGAMPGADALGRLATVGDHTLVVQGHDASTLRFHIERQGAPVARFDEVHEERLHLLVIRDDLSGYQHLHPVMEEDGTWVADVDLARPGRWRIVVDATPTDGDGPLVLGADLLVEGEAVAEALPPPDDEVEADGLVVTRDDLDFTVREADGSEVRGMGLYLGQPGHLVAFRQGDLAYVHVHPDSDRPGELRFTGPLPGPGTYRMFLQFVHDGRVVTVPFTVAIEGDAP